jgi:Domain of unknown function (DUF4160)
MPEISRFYGIIIYMFFSEHNPPHLHVKYQEYEATIDIETGIVHGDIPRRALNLVFEWIRFTSRGVTCKLETYRTKKIS